MTDSAAPSEFSTQRDTVRIALQGLVSARWILIIILIGVGILGELPSLGKSIRWFSERSYLPAVILTIFVWGAANLATQVWIDRLSQFGTNIAGLHVVMDTVAIAILIGCTGGASNPFTVLFVVPITLATLVSPRWTWSVAIVSVLAFGILLEIAPGQSGSDHHNHYAGHLRGMWLALGMAGVLITYFVHRIALGIAGQREELRRLRDIAHRDRELARIGSLAAGAAHELGTPMATVSILTGELLHMSAEQQAEAVDSIQVEMERCKRIISSMASPQLRVEAYGLKDTEPWNPQELAEQLDDRIVAHLNQEIAITYVPKFLVASILRELVTNAAIAVSGQLENISVTVSGSAKELQLIVKDSGVGMNPDVLSAATGPFYSTKESPENMGLGLFLIEAQVRTYGGEFAIDSVPNEGTEVRIRFGEVHTAS